jgi:hypothetical protein
MAFGDTAITTASGSPDTYVVAQPDRSDAHTSQCFFAVLQQRCLQLLVVFGREVLVRWCTQLGVLVRHMPVVPAEPLRFQVLWVAEVFVVRCAQTLRIRCKVCNRSDVLHLSTGDVY